MGLVSRRVEHAPPVMASASVTDTPEKHNVNVPEVTQIQMRAAKSQHRVKSTAPRPDEVPGQALIFTLKELKSQLRRLFTARFQYDQFPGVWKEVRLVLLRKERRLADLPSVYWPIVLFDEANFLNALSQIVSSTT